MTEQGRRLGIRGRSCGLQSPPKKPDCIIKFNSYLKSKIFQSINLSIPVAGNKKGIGVLSSSSHGNPPSDWAVSQQSPPSLNFRIDKRIKKFKLNKILCVWEMHRNEQYKRNPKSQRVYASLFSKTIGYYESECFAV